MSDCEFTHFCRNCGSWGESDCCPDIPLESKKGLPKHLSPANETDDGKCHRPLPNKLSRTYKLGKIKQVEELPKIMSYSQKLIMKRYPMDTNVENGNRSGKTTMSPFTISSKLSSVKSSGATCKSQLDMSGPQLSSSKSYEADVCDVNTKWIVEEKNNTGQGAPKTETSRNRNSRDQLTTPASKVVPNSSTKIVTKLPVVEALCYSRDRNCEITLTRDMQKLYQPGPNLLETTIREHIDLGKGWRNYRNLRLLPKYKDVPGMAHPGLVAIKLHEQETGRQIKGDLIGSRSHFISLIQGKASLRIVLFCNQLFLLDDFEQRHWANPKLMLGRNFEALVTGQKIPAVESACKYDVMVRHEFEGPSKLNLLMSCDVDAVETLGDHGLGNNIEIRCAANDRYMKRTTLKCHLAGGNKLKVGARLHDCSLVNIYDYPLELGPKLHLEWDIKLENVCSYIASVVRQKCASEDGKVQELVLLMKGGIQFDFTKKVTKMPQWFIDHRKMLNATAHIGKLKEEQSQIKCADAGQ